MEDDGDDATGLVLAGLILFGAAIWSLAGYGLYALVSGVCG
jgi:hypothetical protein